MIGIIAGITLRQQLSTGKVILLVLLALLPLPVAVAFVLANSGDNPDEFVAGLLDRVVILGVLPIIALLIGTGVLGNDVQDGTLSYILLKPLKRSVIVLSKLLVATILTAIFVIASTIGTGLIMSSEDIAPRIVVAFVVAGVAGSLIYCAWFVFLSLLTGRAFIAGLLYIFLWEGVISEIFRGARYLSVRQYTRGIADWIADQPEDVFDARMGAVTAIIAATIVTVAATWLATRQLENFEVRDQSA
ncbi:MAG: ABC transporter permease subunit [Dehalococcoidia bacterium]